MAGSKRLQQLWTRADDGVRLQFDGKLVINDWTIHAPLWKKAVVQMVAGKRYPIRLDYFQTAGGAVLQLQWSWAGSAQTFIHRSSLWRKTP